MTGAAIFVPHGGGPMPILGDPSHKDLISLLKNEARKVIGQPKAIVLVTAHWETRNPIISGSSKHELLYDYYNFPKESYELKYDAPGSPQIAKKVYDALKAGGFHPEIDEKRGWDHGVFVPMMLIAPDANIPIVQLSVLESQDPKQLLSMGSALKTLRDDNIAIVGSGMSFHNLREIFSPEAPKGNTDFEQNLERISKLGAKERYEALVQWETLPGANACHPKQRTEHFSPYLVVSGAGNDNLVFHKSVKMFATTVSAHAWD
jgi:aromatic ring-opening dioxygenase catalytic subunit (LigB family)